MSPPSNQHPKPYQRPNLGSVDVFIRPRIVTAISSNVDLDVHPRPGVPPSDSPSCEGHRKPLQTAPRIGRRQASNCVPSLVCSRLSALVCGRLHHLNQLPLPCIIVMCGPCSRTLPRRHRGSVQGTQGRHSASAVDRFTYYTTHIYRH